MRWFVVPLIQTASAVVIPRFLASTYPIAEYNSLTPAFLYNSSNTTTSSDCLLPYSLGLVATDSVVSINLNQLYTSNMESSVCGMCVTIFLTSNSSNNFTAVVADECPECDDGSIALSPTLYQNLLELTSPPNTSFVSPIDISWIESPCPTSPNRIPTMSIAWAQQTSDFPAMQLYGLPSAIKQLFVTWDSYSVVSFSSATWTQLIIPASGFSTTPKQLAFWTLPTGAPTQSGRIGLQVLLRDDTLLVTQSQSVSVGTNLGDVVVALWIPQGNASATVISATAANGTEATGFKRKRSDGYTFDLSNVTIQGALHTV